MGSPEKAESPIPGLVLLAMLVAGVTWYQGYWGSHPNKTTLASQERVLTPQERANQKLALNYQNEVEELAVLYNAMLKHADDQSFGLAVDRLDGETISGRYESAVKFGYHVLEVLPGEPPEALPKPTKDVFKKYLSASITLLNISVAETEKKRDHFKTIGTREPTPEELLVAFDVPDEQARLIRIAERQLSEARESVGLLPTFQGVLFGVVLDEGDLPDDRDGE